MPTRWVKLSLLILSLGFCACSQGSNTWARIQDDGFLIAGIDPTYPPFELVNGQEVFGLDIDLAREVAADLGLGVKFIYFGYDGLYDALATDQVDVLISALVVAPERTRDFAYSDSYFNAGQVIISRDDVPITDKNQLASEILAVELGAQGHVVASSWQRQLPQMSIITFASVDDAIDTVAAGKAAAAIVDAVGGRLYLKQKEGLSITMTDVTDESFAFVVRADDAELLDQLNQSLGRLDKKGTLTRIVSRWLD